MPACSRLHPVSRHKHHVSARADVAHHAQNLGPKLLELGADHHRPANAFHPRPDLADVPVRLGIGLAGSGTTRQTRPRARQRRPAQRARGVRTSTEMRVAWAGLPGTGRKFDAIGPGRERGWVGTNSVRFVREVSDLRRSSLQPAIGKLVGESTGSNRSALRSSSILDHFN